jgi:hypothetical protein
LRELRRPDRLAPGRVRHKGGGRKPTEIALPGCLRPWKVCLRMPLLATP